MKKFHGTPVGDSGRCDEIFVRKRRTNFFPVPTAENVAKYVIERCPDFIYKIVVVTDYSNIFQVELERTS